MKLDLDIAEFVVDDDDRRNPLFRTNVTISTTVLRTAIHTVKGGPTANRPNGEGNKSRDQVRVAQRVVNALTRAKNAYAKDEQETTVDLDVLELKHIRDCMEQWMKEAGIPESWSDWYELLRTRIDKLIDAGEERVAEKLEAPKRNGTTAPATAPETKPATA